MPERNIELGFAGDGLPGCLGMIEEPFEKEDMSEMFRRAFLEKMALGERPDRPTYKCFVCNELVTGRVITAMSHKFHPKVGYIPQPLICLHFCLRFSVLCVHLLPTRIQEQDVQNRSCRRETILQNLLWKAPWSFWNCPWFEYWREQNLMSLAITSTLTEPFPI